MKELRESLLKKIRTADDLNKAIQLITGKLPHPNQSLVGIHKELLAINNSLLPIDLFLRIFSFIAFQSDDQFAEFFVENQKLFRGTLFSLLQVNRLFNSYFSKGDFFSSLNVSVTALRKMHRPCSGIGFLQNILLSSAADVDKKSLLPFHPENIVHLTIEGKKNCALSAQLYFRNLRGLHLSSVRTERLPKMPQLQYLTLLNCEIGQFKAGETLRQLSIHVTIADSSLHKSIATLIRATRNIDLKEFSLHSCFSVYSLLLELADYGFCPNLQHFSVGFPTTDPQMALTRVLARLSRGIISSIILCAPQMTFPYHFFDLFNNLKVARLEIDMNVSIEDWKACILDLSQTTSLKIPCHFPINYDSFNGCALQKLSLSNCGELEDRIMRIVDRCKHLTSIALSTPVPIIYRNVPLYLLKKKSLQFIKIDRCFLTISTAEQLKAKFGRNILII